MDRHPAVQRLHAEARHRGVTIKRAPLTPPLRGASIPLLGLILIDRKLVLPQYLETGAHELGHAIHGHDCTNPSTEAQAWRWAADFLVSVEEYARVERLNPHPNAIALELDLTPKIINEWRKHHGHQHERTLAA